MFIVLKPYVIKQYVFCNYLPSLGFIHVDGKIPFIYDIADMVKDDYIEFCIGDPKRKPMQKTGLILINEKS